MVIGIHKLARETDSEVVLGIEKLIEEASNEFPIALLNSGNPSEVFAGLYGKGVCFYAIDDGRVVGVIGYHDKLPQKFVDRGIVSAVNEPYLHSIIVTKSHRRGLKVYLPLGLACLQNAKGEGFKTLMTRTWYNTNEAPEKDKRVMLYVYSGFKIFHVDPNCPDRHQGVGSVYLRMEL